MTRPSSFAEVELLAAEPPLELLGIGRIGQTVDVIPLAIIVDRVPAIAARQGSGIMFCTPRTAIFPTLVVPNSCLATFRIPLSL